MKTSIKVALVVGGGIVVAVGAFLSGRGWIIPVQYEASIHDEWADATLKAFCEDGYRVHYHRRRVTLSRWMLEGSFVVFDGHGHKFMEGTYVNGTWNGPVTGYYPNGKIGSVEHYVNGKESGIADRWDEAGNRIARITYSEGNKDGAETHWDSQGVAVLSIEWVEGNPDKMIFHENGVPSRILTGQQAQVYLREKALEAAKEIIQSEKLKETKP